MYVLSLITAYLRRQLAPLLAAVAVTLCTAMVVIVISVMGGFLTELKRAAHSITGDLVIEAYNPYGGFRGYEGLIQVLEADPTVARATPSIQWFGLLNLGGVFKPVQVRGVEFESFDEVVGLGERRVWSEEQVSERRDELADFGFYLGPEAAGRFDALDAPFPLDPGPAPRGEAVPSAGALTGVEVYAGNRRNDAGGYDFDASWVGREFALTLVPLNERGTPGSYEPVRVPLVVANDFKSGLYEVDSGTVMMPLGVLQRSLQMAAYEGTTGFDPLTGLGGEPVAVPGRVTQVVVRLADSIDSDNDAELEAARRHVTELVEAHWNRLGQTEGAGLADLPPLVYTWVEMHGQLIGAVQNEKGMVTFLFIVISGVAVVMVATTFYMIVLAKTRDIGVLRAIGAARRGVLGLFLGYGLAVGVVGAAAGVALAVTIVLQLNAIQHFLATYLGVTGLVLGSAVAGAAGGAVVAVAIGFVRQAMAWWLKRLVPLGALVLLLPSLGLLLLREDFAANLNATYRFVMWDPQTYFFDTIPTNLDATEIALIALGAVVSSVLGAVVPALRASAEDPVEALRAE